MNNDYDDPLGPARGCIYGMIIGGIMWAILIAVLVWWYPV